MQPVLPTKTEIYRWILETATHAYHIEYFLQALQVGSEDPDRPHDIVHDYNKFEWEAIKGFALQYRENADQLYKDEIMASRTFHRRQYHHQMWRQPSPTVSADARKLSAVDAICSQLEPRGYQGGVHTYPQIKKIITNSKPHQIPWMQEAIADMEKIRPPNLAEIISFSKIPTEGITAETYDIILGRVHQTLQQLQRDHGYTFPKVI